MARYACQEEMHDCTCCYARMALREMVHKKDKLIDHAPDMWKETFEERIDYHCPNCDTILLICGGEGVTLGLRA